MAQGRFCGASALAKEATWTSPAPWPLAPGPSGLLLLGPCPRQAGQGCVRCSGPAGLLLLGP
eukprot:5993351-Alexandrium_andersonii.AAC.1